MTGTTADFITLVRHEFSPHASSWGMREMDVSSMPALQRILYSGKRRAIRFYLDVKDDYLDALYAQASIFERNGELASPGIASAERLHSVYALIRPEGAFFPTREQGLFTPGRLEQAVKDLVQGIARHQREILDLWPAQGGRAAPGQRLGACTMSGSRWWRSTAPEQCGT